ncbi:uncharacterized protein An18g04430 [Aspergillus niger]|uniref:Contig An18c0150, genomic contig n=2 Tax=Aspergillus niger TaxID=5061 RepID=A2RAV1_ASPNC|nr:uncharacterized protein An18g04430 [Aspergillus niger]CAK43247.1 unnamed protein product [Aspergillus niger]
MTPTAWLLGKLKSAVVLTYGLGGLLFYGLVAVKLGYFFKQTTEKEELELKIARNKFWDLSKKWDGFSHHILTLRNGFKFHYVCNDQGASLDQDKPVVVFIHGFPDSWAIWRNILSSSSLQQSATLIAVDMPGYGGTDSLNDYSPTNVLESLTEFILAIRAKYGVDTEAGVRQKKLVVVAHDWGCVVSMRLAAEAPQLADRFILSNGPLPRLASSNISRLLSASVKMLKTASRSPIQSRSMIFKAFATLSPIFRQFRKSKYIFAMQLPMPLVRYFGRGGNYSFLKLIHRGSFGKREYTPQDAAECFASSLGPSVAESRTQTADGEQYPESLKNERATSSFQHMACYYRDRTAFGALKACATVIWGKGDIALEPQICLDGLADYLVADSQLVELPLSGHFTPLEQESQVALEKAVEWAVKGEKEDIGAVIKACYPTAVVTLRK